MVLAAPAANARHWEGVNLRADVDRLQMQLQSLQLVHNAEHASLVEHQKAFGEAKQIIGQFEKKISELEHGMTKLSADKQKLESDLRSAQTRGSWRRRLKSMIGM